MVNFVTSQQPESTKSSEQIMLRMSPQLLLRIDAYMANLQVKNPGVNVSRADAIRNLTELGLEVGMIDQREEIRNLLGSLTYMKRLEGEMAANHQAPMEAGVDGTSRSVMNGYLLRAKALCPDDEAIQGIEPFEPDNWYGNYLIYQNALFGFLSDYLKKP